MQLKCCIMHFVYYYTANLYKGFRLSILRTQANLAFWREYQQMDAVSGVPSPLDIH